MSKNILKSKTFWVNALAGAAAFFPAVKEFIAQNPEGFVGVLTAVNVIVRFFTRGRVTVFTDA